MCSLTKGRDLPPTCLSSRCHFPILRVSTVPGRQEGKEQAGNPGVRPSARTAGLRTDPSVKTGRARKQCFPTRVLSAALRESQQPSGDSALAQAAQRAKGGLSASWLDLCQWDTEKPGVAWPAFTSSGEASRSGAEGIPDSRSSPSSEAAPRWGLPGPSSGGARGGFSCKHRSICVPSRGTVSEDPHPTPGDCQERGEAPFPAPRGALATP